MKLWKLSQRTIKWVFPDLQLAVQTNLLRYFKDFLGVKVTCKSCIWKRLKSLVKKGFKSMKCAYSNFCKHVPFQEYSLDVALFRQICHSLRVKNLEPIFFFYKVNDFVRHADFH